jgi:hypothetical protein
MRSRLAMLVLLFFVPVAAISIAGEPSLVGIRVDPEDLALRNGTSMGVLVTGETTDGQLLDVTRAATFRSLQPEIATASNTGVITSRNSGNTAIDIEVGGQRAQIRVMVESSDALPSLNFENDVLPMLGRYGCNSSGCHGKAEGQNGFKLSVFGFDSEADYRALVMESRGRRVFPAAPEKSLLLLKASGGLPHGGGVRILPDSPEYEIVRRWIAGGLAKRLPGDPQVVAVELSPRERTLPIGGKQQLRLVVRMSDGSRTDLTHLAKFQSNNEALASVDDEGLVQAGQTPGVVAIMASYMGQVAVFRAMIPRSQSVNSPPESLGFNFIDKHVYRRLQQLQILPANVCGDDVFVRRVYLDLIGSLPTPTEVRKFLDDERPDSRDRLVSELMERPEFADYWALYWSDLLRVDRQALGHKAAYEQYHWIRQCLAQNVPLDEFARQIITAAGPLAEVPQGNFFKTVSQPGEAASTITQVFLGVRMACAQCHHHPYDRWSQSDYVGMTAYFAQLSRQNSPWGEILLANGDPVSSHPRTGQPITAHVLGGPLQEKNPAGDRRKELAAWLTGPANPWFARNLANRVWSRLLGCGLVEPVDDFRATNPPSNPELLDALAACLVECNFDLRSLIRIIVASRVYQHSASTNETNERDEQNYSHFLLKRLNAEVLLDAVCQATGVPERFPGAMPGTRATQLWDSQIDHDFLKLFGRPTRQSACECERAVEPSAGQVLHLLNSERVQNKLSHPAGAVASLVRAHPENDGLIDQLYLQILSRRPNDIERHAAIKHLGSADRNSMESRRKATEDLAWAMLNSLEFVFNH